MRETDYLVVGAGAAGMAFTDTLVAETGDRIVMVDRRASPGGHWNDAYGFVRLHQPSRYYGVESLPLGSDALQPGGPEAGLYERASGAAIRAYYEQVLHDRLIPTGRVRFFPQCEFVPPGRLVSRLTGDAFDVRVRKRVVDGTYLAPEIPATSPPPFAIGEGVRVVPPGALAALSAAPDRFVIVGAGKTAMDVCVWLLERGVDPGRIRWIKPRESWLLNRRYAQPGEHVGSLLEGIAMQLEAAARATSEEDLFARLEAADQFLRVDRSVTPTMYRAATIGEWEVEALRRIRDVVRLGHVQRVEGDRVDLERGTLEASPRDLYVHCAAEGLRRPPPRPMFEDGRITLQPIRIGLVPFAAALVAFVEAHRHDDAEKNLLCPPNPFPDAPRDWVRGTLIQLRADRAWSREPDLAEWLERSRLNPLGGLRSRLGEPAVKRAARRFTESVGPAVAGLAELTGVREAAKPAPAPR